MQTRHIHVNESHDFPNLRDYCYPDEDETGMDVSVQVQGAEGHFAVFYFLGCVCVETLSLVCDDKELTEQNILRTGV